MFNDHYDLTQAVLDGRKTMTRRIVHPSFFTLSWDTRDDTLVYENDFGDFIDIRCSKYCPYKVGEIVAVAQSYKQIYHQEGLETMHMLVSGMQNSAGWTNKMFVRAELMPHRIRITNVRIERLQAIPEDECEKEGIMSHPDFNTCWFIDNGRGNHYPSLRESYAALIDKVSGKGTWQSNPWVWVYEFELVK